MYIQAFYKDKCIAQICFYSESIGWVSVEKGYRGKGIATLLIQLAIKKMTQNNPCLKYVYLDDMSDKPYHEHNLYKKCGFEYINEYPEPEMRLCI